MLEFFLFHHCDATFSFLYIGKLKNFLEVIKVELINLVEIPCPTIVKKPTSRQAFFICSITLLDLDEFKPLIINFDIFILGTISFINFFERNKY